MSWLLVRSYSLGCLSRLWGLWVGGSEDWGGGRRWWGIGVEDKDDWGGAKKEGIRECLILFGR